MTEKAPWPSITGRSIFAGDKEFRSNEKGKTRSQQSSETLEQRKEQGTVPQLVIVGRAERLRRQVLADRWGNPYSRPGSGTR